MKFYELTCLMAPDLSEEELKNFSQKINNFIEEEKGVLEQKTEPKKLKLGYPIKGKTEAFLVRLNFSLNPGNLENLEKKLKDGNQILRYAILIKKPVKITPEKISIAPVPERKKTIEPKVFKKIELKEIDKKIEEILNE